MKASRFITIPILILALGCVAHAQLSDVTSTTTVAEGLGKQLSRLENHGNGPARINSLPDEPLASLDYRSKARRSAVANMFTTNANPFVSASEPESEGVGTEPQAVDQDQWQFELFPYLWIAGVSGRAGVGGLVVNVDAGLTDDNVDLNFGFMARFEARKNRLVILTDLQFSNLGSDHATPGPLFSGATAEFKTFVLDPEVGYRLVLNDSAKGSFLDVLGGIRYWHLKTDLTFAAGLLPQVSASRSVDWVDGVAGIRAKLSLSPRLFVVGKADLGGGGSKLTYQLFGAGGISVGKRYALIGGYRYLNVNYDRDNFLFDVALHGPILGFGIKF